MDTYRHIIPNMLTMSRVALIPLLVLSFYIEADYGAWIAGSLFFLAGITDYFDGLLARQWRVQTQFGQFLDPVADKLFVAAVLIMLIHLGRLGNIDVLAALIILCREIFVSGLREFLGSLQIAVPVSFLAKIKTVTQMLALFLLILGVKIDENALINLAGTAFLWIAAVLTCITGYAYFRASYKHIQPEVTISNKE